jgi:hypothetical protein
VAWPPHDDIANEVNKVTINTIHNNIANVLIDE